MTAAPPAQLDWIRLEDHRAAARRFLAAAAERIGIPELAHWLGEDPSTLRNQLAYRDRKRPSAELCQLVWLLDEQYRREMAGLLGETIAKPPDLTAAEALREATVRAQAQGYIAAPDIAALLARMKPEDR